MQSDLSSLPNLTSDFLSSGNATGPHFATHHEGSLQVPIPCAVVNVVFITVLIIALIALSGGWYFINLSKILINLRSSHFSHMTNF